MTARRRHGCLPYLLSAMSAPTEEHSLISARTTICSCSSFTNRAEVILLFGGDFSLTWPVFRALAQSHNLTSAIGRRPRWTHMMMGCSLHDSTVELNEWYQMKDHGSGVVISFIAHFQGRPTESKLPP